MAYQNTGSPRFYINTLEFLLSNGLIPSVLSGFDYELLHTIPTKMIPLPNTQIYLSPFGSDLTFFYENNQFFAILGHTLGADAVSYLIQGDAYPFSYVDTAIKTINASFNTPSQMRFSSPYDGFTLVTYPADFTNWISLDDFDDSLASSLIIGNYYDMPYSPELSLTMTREMDGVDRLRTLGGNDLVDYRYTSATPWGDVGAWELVYQPTAAEEGLTRKISRTGRRVWDLSFSHLDDGDVFGSNQRLESLVGIGQYAPPLSTYGANPNDYESTDLNGSNFEDNILTDNSFYSQVIHKTNGGQLPFLFQHDSSIMNHQNLAICKLDMDSFKFDQVANGVYSCKIRIREVW